MLISEVVGDSVHEAESNFAELVLRSLHPI
jgi:hypothetical protein